VESIIIDKYNISWQICVLSLTAKRVASGGRPSAGARDLVAGSWCGLDVAPVHLVDNGAVGVGEVCASDVRSADDGEVVQVLGDDGERAASEGGGSVVHQRTVIVRHAEVGGASHLVEVVSHVAWDRSEHDSKVAVTVWTALFVVETDCVSELMSDDAWDGAAASLKGHLVRTMVVAHGGVASTSAEDFDVVAVAGGSGKVTSSWGESNASFAHPHLHSLVDGLDLTAAETAGDFVRDDSLGPSVPVALHSSSGESGNVSVLGGIHHWVHVHVHVKVNFLVVGGTQSSSLHGSGGGDDLIDGPVIGAVFDFKFRAHYLLSTEAFNVTLFSRNDSKRQEGDQEMCQSHFEVE